jgi:hypothetical protein
MEKLLLREIAKRWCKGVLLGSEASFSFEDSGLSQDQIDYIQSEIMKIATRITPSEAGANANDLVNEYFE